MAGFLIHKKNVAQTININKTVENFFIVNNSIVESCAGVYKFLQLINLNLPGVNKFKIVVLYRLWK